MKCHKVYNWISTKESPFFANDLRNFKHHNDVLGGILGKRFNIKRPFLGSVAANTRSGHRIGVERSMSKPSPHNFSLSSSVDLSSHPYFGWLEFTQKSKQFYEVRNLLSGMPSHWLEWVDKQISNYSCRGNVIRDPIKYRISILWNGIILLQESKFIGDITENTLRRSLIDFMTIQKLTFSDLQIPEWSNKNFTSLLFNYPRTQADFIAEHFTFYQLYGTFQENCTIPQKTGFWVIFAKQKYLNLALFKADMKTIKQTRNDIAHSRKLFRPDEVRNLYKIANKWLIPLGVNLADRVKVYRQLRPNFLNDLDL
jgi:hypothetical protein